VTNYLDQAAEYSRNERNWRAEASRLNTSSSPRDKAKAALLDRKADREREFAQGALNNALGISNEL
jgi:hypothetical protein